MTTTMTTMLVIMIKHKDVMILPMMINLLYIWWWWCMTMTTDNDNDYNNDDVMIRMAKVDQLLLLLLESIATFEHHWIVILKGRYIKSIHREMDILRSWRLAGPLACFWPMNPPDADKGLLIWVIVLSHSNSSPPPTQVSISFSQSLCLSKSFPALFLFSYPGLYLSARMSAFAIR